MINRIFTKIPPIALMNWVIILFWMGWAIFHSLYEAINIPTIHWDGAFQTSSALYRLDEGQFPGKDFYPYLGVGPLYVLYPIFKALGSDISSSIFSSYFAVAVVAMLSSAFIWHMVWQPKSFITSVAAGSALFFLIILIVKVTGAFNLSFTLLNYDAIGLTPGHSLRSLRSFAPCLTAIIFYFFVLKISSARMKYLAAGCLTGLLLLWSNDYAISTSLLFVALVIALSRNELRFNNVLVYLLLFVFTWAILLSMVTLGHPIELLKYNFLDVAKNQWWYFAPYNESDRIFTIRQFAQLFILGETPVALIVMAILAFLAWKYKSLEYTLLLWVGAALFSGGIVASVGGHYGFYYFEAFYYWSIAIIIVGCTRLIWSRFSKQITEYRWAPRVSAKLFMGIMCVPMVIGFYRYMVELSEAKEDTNRFFVHELGGYLPKEWYDYIELARNTPSNQLVAEEYWGIWSALRRSFFNWPVDSVIHALGDTRNIAMQKLQNADTVISTRLSASLDLQPWNVSQNYWFYKNLLSQYSVSALSPKTVVWKKSPDTTSIPIMVDCRPELTSAGMPLLRINVPAPGYYEMNVQYKITKSHYQRALLLVQNNINFAMDSNGYISIDPKSTEVQFPAYFNHDGQADLNVKIFGKAEMILSSCIAKRITFDDKDVLSPQPFLNNRLDIDK
ncbi:MAG: hypothetical protein Q8N96_14480 [Methylovulum sp.]|nr:hypothetical protein [Methylovulum sp.]